MHGTTDIILLTVAGLSLLAILSTYVLYPIVMAVAARMSRTSRKRDETLLPDVTMVVAAYNEIAVIEEKVLNFLTIDYPAEKLFLVVGSDGSSDGTNEVLERFADGERIRWFDFGRGGKISTLNNVMKHVHTPFVIFSDANTMYDADAVRKLMRHFADERIGGVCGNLLLRPSTESVGSTGESTYWSYENLLKRWEGEAASVLGATGGIYAIRRELIHEMPVRGQLADDLLVPFGALTGGKRFLYDSEAIAREDTEDSMQQEFRRKIRVALGTFNTIPDLRPMLRQLPASLRIMFFMHKTLRWLVPFFLLLIPLALLPLYEHQWVRCAVLYPTLLFTIIGLVGWIAESLGRRLGPFSLPFYFLAINLALIIAWAKLAFRYRPTATWDRPART